MLVITHICPIHSYLQDLRPKRYAYGLEGLLLVETIEKRVKVLVEIGEARLWGVLDL
jgi:hypothetical protein